MNTSEDRIQTDLDYCKRDFPDSKFFICTNEIGQKAILTSTELSLNYWRGFKKDEV